MEWGGYKRNKMIYAFEVGHFQCSMYDTIEVSTNVREQRRGRALKKY